MHKVLVLDANQRSALAIIRSLGRRGLQVIAADHLPHSLGGASRYAEASITYSDPAESPRTFAAEVSAAATRLGVDTIIPATDLTTMLLASQPDLWNSVHLAAPNAESYEALTNKARLFELAAALGISAPLTRTAHDPSATIDAALELGFPVVLKPARSRYLKGNRIVATNVRIVHDVTTLRDTVQRCEWLQDIPCLVQSFVSGKGAGIFALYGASTPRAWFAHQRIREKPPSGGVSVLSESVAVDPTMKSAAAALLSAAQWSGVAMVEFKVAYDGTPYLMEVNGRFWGSLQLAIDAGVDFPWLLYRQTHGLPEGAPPAYTLGRRLRWFLGDVDSLLIELRQRTTPFPTKTRALANFAKSSTDSNCRQEVFRMDDPRPALRESLQWIRDLL